MDLKQIKSTRISFLVIVLIHLAIMNVAYFLLVANFSFPEVLRWPADKMFALFIENIHINLPAYYLFTLSGFTFIGLTLLAYFSFTERGPLLKVGLVFGILAGLMQAFGFSRWVFLMPFIAETYNNPATTVAAKETLLLILNAFHQYAGVTIGENLAFICHGIWGVLTSVAMLKGRDLARFFGWSGILVNGLVGLYSLEQFGGAFAGLGPWNVGFQVSWLVWMMCISFFFLKAKEGEPFRLGVKHYAGMGVVLAGMMTAAYV